jgi:GTP-binding protein
MIDATVGIEAKDMHIFQNIVENKKGIVIAVNKWDLIQDKYPNITKDYEEEIKNKTAPFKDLPIVFISAKDKTRLIKLLETAIDVHNRKKTHIPTHELNDFFQEITNVTPPPSVKGKFVKIKYVTQVEGAPIFLLFCNLPQYVSDSYKRFLENKIRERYNFTGVPITLVFKKK